MATVFAVWIGSRFPALAGRGDPEVVDREGLGRRHAVVRLDAVESADAVDRRANRGDHLAFGLGAHDCLGAHLARMESIRGFAFRSPDRLPVRFG